MNHFVKLLAVTAVVATTALPGIASAQNAFGVIEQKRHDRNANEGFSTNRDTTGTDRDGGYVRYSAGSASSSRLARSSDEAERQYRRGNDAYAAGEYGSACQAFRHARNLYARVGDGRMSEESASVAADACAMARTNSSG